MIGATLQRPKAIEHQGTARIFSTEWFEQCDPVYRFKVVVETRRGGDNNKVMGIVTAAQDFR